LAVGERKEVQRHVAVGLAHHAGRVHRPRPMLGKLKVCHAELSKIGVAGRSPGLNDLVQRHKAGTRDLVGRLQEPPG
jgi:hypothetical protein